MISQPFFREIIRLRFLRNLELLITLFAFAISFSLTNRFTFEQVVWNIEILLTCCLAMGIYFILFKTFNQAKISRHNPLGVILTDTFILNTLAAVILLSSDWLIQFDSVPALFITLFTLSTCMLLLVYKFICLRILNIYYTDALHTRRVLIIGHENAFKLTNYLNKQKQYGYRVVGIVSQTPKTIEGIGTSVRIFPSQVNIQSLIKFDIIDEVFCFDETLQARRIIELADFCNKLGITFYLHSSRPELLMLYKTQRQIIVEWEFEQLSEPMNSVFCQFTKTAFEVSVSFLILLSIAPILVILSVLIAVTSKGSIIFKQERVGLHGRKFYIYKFRTMVQNAEELKVKLIDSNESDGPVFKIKHDPRITPIGRILRRTSLDELPQFFNIIKGEMSLVGPRPPIPAEVIEYENWHLKRLSVKPGLTCTWQILPNRNDVKFDEWMRLDIQYITGWNFQSDIKLFFQTFFAVFFTRGY